MLTHLPRNIYFLNHWFQDRKKCPFQLWYVSANKEPDLFHLGDKCSNLGKTPISWCIYDLLVMNRSSKRNKKNWQTLSNLYEPASGSSEILISFNVVIYKAKKKVHIERPARTIRLYKTTSISFYDWLLVNRWR